MTKSNLIKNVDIISMVDDQLLKTQDVLIEGTQIKTICNTGTQNLQADETIDATGQFLMPGLFDMHVHVHDEPYMPLFLMNGITGIRDLGSVTDIFKRRDNIASGKELGPRLFVSGKILEGDPPTWGDAFYVIKTKKQALETIHWLKNHKTDQVKVYDSLPAELYKTSIKEAKKQGLKVAGHLNQYMPAAETINLGLDSVEHFGITLGWLIGDITRELSKIPGAEDFNVITKYKINDKKLHDAAEAFKTNNAYLCPTLILEKQLSQYTEYKELLKQVDTRYFDPNSQYWIPKKANGEEGLDDRNKLFYENIKSLREGTKGVLKTLKKSATILAGTDTPNPFVMPGYSLHQELELLVEAGLTNYEALQATTTNATKYLDVSDELGTVETGKTANLILLTKNHLKNIKNTTTIQTVILNGQPHTQKSLAQQAQLKS
jgi:imidazolonepropionase-like amidohydrolase